MAWFFSFSLILSVWRDVSKAQVLLSFSSEKKQNKKKLATRQAKLTETWGREASSVQEQIIIALLYFSSTLMERLFMFFLVSAAIKSNVKRIKNRTAKAKIEPVKGAI